MDKYGRLDRELQLANSHFIEEQQAQQQVPENHQPSTGRWEARYLPPRFSATPGALLLMTGRMDQSLPCSCLSLPV